MNTATKVLTALAGLAFVLAVLTNFTGPIAGTGAEGFSRACTNLALLAIAVSLIFDRSLSVRGSNSLP
jgi:hypothetical protein